MGTTDFRFHLSFHLSFADITTATHTHTLTYTKLCAYIFTPTTRLSVQVPILSRSFTKTISRKTIATVSASGKQLSVTVNSPLADNTWEGLRAKGCLTRTRCCSTLKCPSYNGLCGSFSASAHNLLRVCAHRCYVHTYLFAGLAGSQFKRQPWLTSPARVSKRRIFKTIVNLSVMKAFRHVFLLLCMCACEFCVHSSVIFVPV